MAKVGSAKEFLLGGMVADVAIGGLIGAAITPFITSTIDDILMPLFGLVSGYKLQKQYLLLEKGHTPPYEYDTKEDAMADGAIVMPYGNFLYSSVKFLSVIVIAFGTAKMVSKLRTSDIDLTGAWQRWVTPGKYARDVKMREARMRPPIKPPMKPPMRPPVKPPMKASPPPPPPETAEEAKALEGFQGYGGSWPPAEASPLFKSRGLKRAGEHLTESDLETQYGPMTDMGERALRQQMQVMGRPLTRAEQRKLVR